MIDTNVLRGLIYQRNLSQRKLAQMLGMTEKTFYSKMSKGIFGSDEIEKMISILNIKRPERIFFVNLVTQKVTKRKC